MKTPEETIDLHLIQRGAVVAEVSGPPERAWPEIMHYAMVYAQDGPVVIKEAQNDESRHPEG